jgi:transcription elongation GreA/GreB family factor
LNNDNPYLNLRERLYAACSSHLEERINSLLKEIKDLEQALRNEAKSSAGDKYETGREMINAELHKLGLQLESFRKMKLNLGRIALNKPSDTVAPGAVVKTTAGNYYLAVPAGEITVDGKKYYTLGIQAPFAQAMLGKSVGESISWNDRSFEILELA